MGMFDGLMERCVRAGRGHFDPNSEKRFYDSNAPNETKRWDAYIKAEICRQNNDLAGTHRWLEAALDCAGENESPIWRAEIAACQARIEIAYDEPQQAIEWAHTAWQARLGTAERALEGSDQLRSTLREIESYYNQLCAEAQTSSEVAPVYVISSWLQDRLFGEMTRVAKMLLQLAGSLGAMDLAREVARETASWAENLPPEFLNALIVGPDVDNHATPPDPRMAEMAKQVIEQTLIPMRNTVTMEVTIQLADAEDKSGNSERALEQFEQALQFAQAQPADKYWDSQILQLGLNRTNQLAKLGRTKDARLEYERLLLEFQSAGNPHGVVAARFGAIGCAWRLGERSDTLAGQLEVIASLEEMLADEPSDLWVREMLLSTYQLLANMIAVEPKTHSSHLLILLQVLYAIREPDSVAGIGVDPHERNGQTTETSVAVLLSRFSRLEKALVLIWEPGAESLVLTCIASGPSPLVERVDLSCIPIDSTSPLNDLVAATGAASDQLSQRAIGLKVIGKTKLEEKARAVWDLMPDTVARMITDADTIFFSPSNRGALDELPFEALHDGESFLGIKKNIVRVPSLSRLSAALAPNRYRQAHNIGSLLITAKDPYRVDGNETLEKQVEYIEYSLKEFEPTFEHLLEPSPKELIDRVARSARVMHFVGHGFAGEAGEVLVLSETQQVLIADVTPTGGLRAPFAYFSACEVGRGRHMAGGAQRGLASLFLDAGAPAIVAPTYRIPSHFMGQIASEFYACASSAPVGQALQETRRLLHKQKYHPACWATLALFGDPYATISDALADVSASEQTRGWSSLVFQYIATNDVERLDGLERMIAIDPRLDPDTTAAVVAWMRSLDDAGERQPDARDELVARVAELDGEGGATLRILSDLEQIVGVVSDSPLEERQHANSVLSWCFGLSTDIHDSYATLVVIKRVIDGGIAMDDIPAIARLLGRAVYYFTRVSLDQSHLEPLAAEFAKLRKKLESFTVVSLGNKFGYSNDAIRKADEGDPDALTEVASAIMTSSARAEVFAGDRPWYFWLLRWVGAGTRNTGGDALGVLATDVRLGRLSPDAAQALTLLFGELRIPVGFNPEIAQRAVQSFTAGGPEYASIDIALINHAVTSGGRVAVSDLEYAEELAAELEGRIGQAGAAALMRLVLAEHYAASSEIDMASQRVDASLEEFTRLYDSDDQYTTHLARAAMTARHVAELAGNREKVNALIERYAEVIEEAASEDRGLRDQHGDLADYSDDFRPSGDDDEYG